MTKALLLTVSFLLVSPLKGERVVEISEGWIDGVTRVSQNGRLFYAFLGIPYAEPPLGDLRFENPVPKKQWHFIWKANKDPVMCPQAKGNVFQGDEDCLYLNVYTPRITTEQGKSLPVMVYLPGGAFKSGDGRSDHWRPEYILDKDVVLVTVQYRLGILGFLSTGDTVSPGNYGMKDQVLALHWVRRNIQRLGGNPGRVTLIGHSAGAVSVAAHTVSPLSKGLFHQYIEMSGNFYFTWSNNKGRENNYISIGRNFARLCGCPTNDSLSMVTCLKRANVTDLIAPNDMLHKQINTIAGGWGFIVEPNSTNAFLSEKPIKIIRERGGLDVPFMMGLVKADGLLETIDMYVDENKYNTFINDEIDDYIGRMLAYFTEPEEAVQLVSKVKDFYCENLTNVDRYTILSVITQCFTDVMFSFPIYKQANSQLRYGTQPFYVYSFEYRGSISRTQKYTGTDENLGVGHADELTYLFKQDPASLGTPNGTYSEQDKTMMRIMVDLWTSFAATGQPISAELKNPFEWKPYTCDRNYLRIGEGRETTTDLQRNLRSREMEFLAKNFGP